MSEMPEDEIKGRKVQQRFKNMKFIDTEDILVDHAQIYAVETSLPSGFTRQGDILVSIHIWLNKIHDSISSPVFSWWSSSLEVKNINFNLDCFHGILAAISRNQIELITDIWSNSVEPRGNTGVLTKEPLGSTKDSGRRDEGGQGITEVCPDASRELGTGRKGPSKRRRRGVTVSVKGGTAVLT
ncbi:hypothetical protein DFH09DRAFT_1091698 [Mycena vulgaris]|nr:hypothetical protein DFH09DRAFT_1091698 [Mycena vulgaris]